MYIHVCVLTLAHSPSLSFSPHVFFCFLQLLSYTEMQNDSFFCLVQTCFPLSLTTEFKSSDFGCRGALSLVAFLFFQVFLILQGKKASCKLLFSALNYIIIIRFTFLNQKPKAFFWFCVTNFLSAFLSPTKHKNCKTSEVSASDTVFVLSFLYSKPFTSADFSIFITCISKTLAALSRGCP